MCNILKCDSLLSDMYKIKTEGFSFSSQNKKCENSNILKEEIFLELYCILMLFLLQLAIISVYYFFMVL